MTGQSRVDISPNDKQAQFFGCKDKFILYGGAKGGGKSWAIRTKQILRRFNYPNSRGLLLRRTYPELLQNHIFKIQEEWPQLKYDKQEQRFMFPNGSWLKLGTAQHEWDIMKYQGSEFDDIGMDEATSFTEYQFDILRSCLRTNRTDLKTQMYLGGNPGGVGHGWVKRIFIGDIKENHTFIPAKLYDNPVLMKSDPNYVNELESLPENLRRAYLEGDWDIFSGQVFSEWRRELHIVDYFMYPLEFCKKTICFDWGYNAPGCALWLAHTPEGHVYAYREIYQTQKTAEDWGKEIKTYLEIEPVEQFILPHDCFSNQPNGKSIAQMFEECGIPKNRMVRGHTLDKNARKNRLAIMHQYLSKAPDGIPWLQIHQNCKNTIRTLPELVYSKTDPEDINSEGEDHCLTGNTKILTSKGWISIKDVDESKITRYNARTVMLETETGEKLQCTPDHKILTPQGWIKAERLKATDLILWSSQEQYKNIKEKDIIYAEVTIVNKVNTQEVQKGYIDKFGKIIMGMLKRGIIFTIKTAIILITKYITSILKRNGNTLVIIPIIQQTNKKKQEEEMRLDPVEKAILQCLESNGVKRLKKVGYTEKKENVYDINVNHPLHGFIASGGFIVHNCYDAISLGLLQKVFNLMESGAVKAVSNKSPEWVKTFETTPEGEVIVPDFWEAMKQGQRKKTSNIEFKGGII